MTPCFDYRPDHNGECLNCDEPYDAHDLNDDDNQLVGLHVVRAATDTEQLRAMALWLAKEHVRHGASHECDEWRDFYSDRRCAVCGSGGES